MDRFVERLLAVIDVEKVILCGDYASGTPSWYSDIRLLVISPSFDSLDWINRGDLLARYGGLEEPLIVAWGFTPGKIAAHLAGDRYELFLAHALSESREVYHQGPAALASRGNKR
ncbi:MAG TPA: hypothetical protein VFY10_14915 [Dehalococcoidia bacterium]|nr:hypothetical protein [Dehalococcoidia bacterium]